MGGNADDTGNDIEIDIQGNLYCTGGFTNSVDFDPGAAIFQLTSAGLRDAFVSKFMQDGSFLWTMKMGGTGFDEGHAIAIDANGSLNTSGAFTYTADFDPLNSFTLTAAGADDFYVARYDGFTNMVNENSPDQIYFYPNPVTNTLTIQFQQIVEQVNISITTTTGNILFESSLEKTDKILLDLKDWTSGIYLLNAKSRTFNKVTQIVLIN